MMCTWPALALGVRWHPNTKHDSVSQTASQVHLGTIFKVCLGLSKSNLGQGLWRGLGHSRGSVERASLGWRRRTEGDQTDPNWWWVSKISWCYVFKFYVFYVLFHAIFKCWALLCNQPLQWQHEMTVALGMWTVGRCWNYAMQVVEMSPKTDQEDEEERTKELRELIWLCSFSPFSLETCKRQDLPGGMKQ